GDHGRASIEPCFEQPIPRLRGDLERLRALALRQEHRGDLEARSGQASGDDFAVESLDGRIGEEGELAPHPEPGDFRADLGEQPRAHRDAIGAGAELDGDVDHRTSRLPGLEVVEIALVVAAYL